MKMFNLFLKTAFFILPITASAQLTATFTTTENTNCAGVDCGYEGPGILINEIMISPLANDGSLWGGTAAQAGEWIELYNPDVCEAIDISCWYLGNNANDPVAYPGGFVIPAGTVVPPAGFVILRGINMTPVPIELLVQNGGNTIEIVVDQGVCVGGGTRLWFPNAGGWFAFYDNNGIPQDAVSWASQANISLNPCVPNLAGCTDVSGLVTYSDVPPDRKTFITATNPSVFQGQSLRRIPDGGTWSEFGVPTYGFCNENCAQVGGTTCTGTATVGVEGGTPPYIYFWPGAQGQNGQTAVDLCTNTYEVIVFDALGVFQSFFVTIEEPSFESEVFESICQGDVFILPDFTPINQAGVYPVMLQTADGCDSLVTFNIDVLPVYSNSENVTICPGDTYTMPDGSQIGAAGSYSFDFPMANGCDSTITVNLSVEQVITVPSSPEICEGDTYTLPNGQIVNATGIYEVTQGTNGCDTLFVVSLTVNPAYFENVSVQLCEGEIYVLPDGTVVSSTGTYLSNLLTTEGCDSIIQVQLAVFPLPILAINLQDDYCYGTGSVALNPTPSGGDLMGSNISGNTLNLNNVGPGTYPVTYAFTDANGCSSVLNTSYNVTSPIFPSFEYLTYCNTATFTNTTPNQQPNFEYTWLLDNNLVSTSSSFEYPFQNSGEYDMELEVTDAAGCSYSTSQGVVFESALDLSEFIVANVITANSDNMNDVLKIKPSDNECLEYKLVIYTRWGKKVYEMTNTSLPFSGKNENGAELSEGTYFYQFESPQIDCNNPLFEPYCKGTITLLR